MIQETLFPNLEIPKIVNVASVPLRSPFRYPGGKTWLVPWVRRWLKNIDPRPTKLVEPFAGGGIISLTAAFEKLVDSVEMVEIDADVASVWNTILGDHGAWLAESIVSFEMSSKAVTEVLSHPPATDQERAFQTLLRNRINHGGILAPGSGVLKHGENGKGIKSRWYPETLKRRIMDIIGVKDRISFIRGDGFTSLRTHKDESDTAYFIDPPYTAGGKNAGRRLYAHNDVDHEQLFRLAGELKGDFLMTYDNAEDVRSLAVKQNFDMHLVSMKNTHHTTMTELLIGRDLEWARNPKPAWLRDEPS